MAKTTHIAVLIDESGSMGPQHAAVIDGFNEFLQGLQSTAEGEVRLSLLKFDKSGLAGEKGGGDIIRPICENKKLEKVKPLKADDYRPRGSTPLNDAVLETIERLGGFADKDRAMVVIMTDGYENASMATKDDVKKLIKSKEKSGWEFIYMGANVDAFSEAGGYGIAASNAKSWTSSPSGTRSAARVTSNLVSSYTTSNEAFLASNAALGAEVPEDEQESLLALERMTRARKQAE